MPNNHILPHYDEAIEGARQSVLEQGRILFRLIGETASMIERRDPALSTGIIRKIESLPAANKNAMDVCASVITTFSPIAGDLRHIVSLVRILEKFEDAIRQSKTLAERGRAIAQDRGQDNGTLLHLLGMAGDEFGNSLVALQLGDKSLAAHIREDDRKLDRLHRQMIAAIIAGHDPASGAPLDVDRIFFIQAVERVGDCAKAVSKNVLFM